MIALKKGTLCTINGLKNRTDLNGFKCTVKTTKLKKGNHERIPVTVFHDGSEMNILLKRENLCPYINTPDILQGLSGLNVGEDEHQLLRLATNTVNDVNEIQFKYNSLVQRLEEAISHRNRGHFADAEKLLEKVLSAAEDLCGKRSVKVATFLKSFGILRVQQRRWNEAEDFLLRADELRPSDCEENSQGTQTLEYIVSAQINGRVFKKASDTLTRLRDLKHCVRPGIDMDPSELETELEAAKKSHAQCVVCRRCSILSACARCHLTVYCSRSCQKSHWRIHKRICQTTSRVSLNENFKLQSSKTPFDFFSLCELVEKNDSDVLTSSVLCNALATQNVTSSCPTELDHILLSALADTQQSYFFCMNELTSSTILESNGGRRRFMATAGVFSCVTVFAWSKSTCANKPGLCFGAHVSNGALLRGLRACRESKVDIDRALSPLLLNIRECFQGCTQDFFVTLIGGHRAMDSCEGLKAMFPEDKEKWSFAWHVQNACEVALDGISIDSKVSWNTNLLLRFEGEKIKSMIDEERVRQKHMNFMVVALDTITGQLVTHTKYTNMGSILTEAVLNRQREAYKDPIDPKLRIASFYKKYEQSVLGL